MMGAELGRQERLFYEFRLQDRVPANHLLRKIDAVLDLGRLRAELKPFYSPIGRDGARSLNQWNTHFTDSSRIFREVRDVFRFVA